MSGAGSGMARRMRSSVKRVSCRVRSADLRGEH
jgi:hypothetical protein